MKTITINNTEWQAWRLNEEECPWVARGASMKQRCFRSTNLLMFAGDDPVFLRSTEGQSCWMPLETLEMIAPEKPAIHPHMQNPDGSLKGHGWQQISEIARTTEPSDTFRCKQ